MKKRIITLSAILFISLLFFYAIAALNKNSTALLPVISTKITIISTYPAAFFNKITNIKLNGIYLSFNFILVSIILAFVINAIANIKHKKNSIK
ncbi:hypothetical protein ABIB30_002640 [Pedobacter sp. UYP1]